MGASRWFKGAANVYMGSPGLIPEDVMGEASYLGKGNYKGGAEVYIKSKEVFCSTVAKAMRERYKASWCVCESGTAGPDFITRGVNEGFTAIAVAGPDGFLKESTQDRARGAEHGAVRCRHARTAL